MPAGIMRTFREGMSAVECVKRIVSLLPDVTVINLLKYEVKSNLRQRLVLRDPSNVFDRVEELQVHDGSGRRLLQIDRSNLRNIDRLIEETIHSPGIALGIASKVCVSGHDDMHIPMMDLRIGISDANQAEVAQILQSISPGRGVLLASGESYHFYSIDLLSGPEWVAFMGRSLLLSPWVDDRYIAHRLVDGFSVLRLTPTTLKPTAPFVVEAW